MVVRVWATVASLAICGACSKSAAPPLVVESVEQPMMYQWRDALGRIQTARQVDAIPAAYRAQVFVTDPESDVLLPPGWVMLGDFSRPEGATYRMVHLTYESPPPPEIATPFLPPSPPSVDTQAPPPVPPAPAPRREPTQEEINEKIRDANLKIILYSTQWCGVCREAKRYFDSIGVRYTEKDVEKDPSVGDEFMRKLKSTGREKWGVPVIDVEGDISVGFSAPNMQAQLMRKAGVGV